MSNTELWDLVFRTPIEETKPITGKLYRGTSPDPYYLIRKATETFGPCGIGWGFISEHSIINGTDGTAPLSVAKVKVWYRWKDERGEVEHYGGTPLIVKRRDGTAYLDEDAAKKSTTDGLTKALSLLGFAGDIFSGLYDDSKYVSDLKAEAKAQPTAAEIQTPQELHPLAESMATGELKPYRIDMDTSGPAKEQSVWIKFGQLLLAGITTAQTEKTIDEWLAANSVAMIAMSKDAPKTHKRLSEAIGIKRDTVRDQKIQIHPNAKDRAANGEAKLLPPADSAAALEGLLKTLARVGHPIAMASWMERAEPAFKAMQADDAAKLEAAIEARQAEFVPENVEP